MKKYLRVCGVFLLAVLLAAFCAACGNEDTGLDLADLQTKQYTNESNGATVTVPIDWEVASEAENCTVFENGDGTISFVLKWELGGMSYFSKQELAGLAADIGKATLQDAEVYQSLELTKFDAAVKAVCTGTAENGVTAVCDTAIIQYFHDVRYYLTAVTDAGTYAEYEKVFTQIANSFTCALTEDEVYEKMNEQTAAILEEEMQQEQNTEENFEQE